VKSVTQDLEALRQQRAAAQAKKAQQAQQAEQELIETLGRVSSIVEPTDNENAWLI
jgi:transcription elongation GreA/GreB family factor